ncbi:MAG TPA: tetratricopeptide repeat protein, partial [Acidobacteriota bacterium]|nr:tetratricopeptide repeat protein [Acidobacteriota bacterium]
PGLLPRHNMYLSPASLVDVFPTLITLLNMDSTGLKVDGLPLFEKGSDREVKRDYLFGGSFFRTIAGVPPVYFVRSPGWKLVTGLPDLMFSPTSDNSPSNTDVSRKMAAEMKPRLLSLHPSFSTMKPAGDLAAAVRAGQAIETARKGNVEEAFHMLPGDTSLPATPSLLALRSELAEATGRLEEAIDLSQRAYRAVPEPEFLAITARQRARALQFEEAQSLMARFSKDALQISYYDHNMIGIIRSGLGDFEAAIREFDLALKDNPQFLDSLIGRSRCFIRLAENGRALSDLRRAVELAPQDAEVNRELAALMLKSSTPQDAAPYLRQMLELDPRDFSAMLDLARLHESTGNSAEADRLARKILTSTTDPVLVTEAKKIIAR